MSADFHSGLFIKRLSESRVKGLNESPSNKTAHSFSLFRNTDCFPASVSAEHPDDKLTCALQGPSCSQIQGASVWLQAHACGADVDATSTLISGVGSTKVSTAKSAMKCLKGSHCLNFNLESSW